MCNTCEKAIVVVSQEVLSTKKNKKDKVFLAFREAGVQWHNPADAVESTPCTADVSRFHCKCVDLGRILELGGI